MEYPLSAIQWTLTVEVAHAPSFGHCLTMITQSKARVPYTQELGSWKGLGIPEGVMRSASGLLVAAFEEHLVTRYGVQGELPTRWSGEPEPF